MRVDLGFISMIGRLITACGIKSIGQWQWLFKDFWLYCAVEPANILDVLSVVNTIEIGMIYNFLQYLFCILN